MMEWFAILIGAFIAWASVGLGLVACTELRGRFADALFVLTWPIHVYRHMRGLE